MKTIKQVADELGVSKEKVRYRVRNLPSECVEKRGKITYLTDGGAAIIQGFLTGEPRNFSAAFAERITHLNPPEETRRIIELEEKVKSLEWQLEYERASAEKQQNMTLVKFKEEIERTDQMIEDFRKWQKIIEQEQQLRMADKAPVLKQLSEPQGRWARLKAAWKG